MAGTNNRRPGRPEKLSPEIQKRVCDCIRAGNFIEVAASYAGIHRDTMHDWMRKGAQATSGKYFDFHESVTQALAEAEVRDVTIIARAAEMHWQAAAWRLERKFPKRWGRNSRHEIVRETSDAKKQKLVRFTKTLTDEQLSVLAQVVEAADAAEDFAVAIDDRSASDRVGGEAA